MRCCCEDSRLNCLCVRSNAWTNSSYLYTRLLKLYCISRQKWKPLTVPGNVLCNTTRGSRHQETHRPQRWKIESYVILKENKKEILISLFHRHLQFISFPLSIHTRLKPVSVHRYKPLQPFLALLHEHGVQRLPILSFKKAV